MQGLVSLSSRYAQAHTEDLMNRFAYNWHFELTGFSAFEWLTISRILFAQINFSAFFFIAPKTPLSRVNVLKYAGAWLFFLTLYWAHIKFINDTHDYWRVYIREIAYLYNKT